VCDRKRRQTAPLQRLCHLIKQRNCRLLPIHSLRRRRLMLRRLRRPPPHNLR
jgi:hypothetical protein